MFMGPLLLLLAAGQAPEAAPAPGGPPAPEAAPAPAAAAPAPPGAPAASARKRSTGGKLRVLVLQPSAGSNEEDQVIAKAVSGLIPVELAPVTAFDVLAASDVQAMIELEAEKEAIGCTDSSCLAELAGALGADLVVFGDVTRLGTLILVNLNLFDSNETRAAGRVSIQTKNIEELPGKLGPAVRSLVGPFLEKKGLGVPEEWKSSAQVASGGAEGNAPTTMAVTPATEPKPATSDDGGGGGLFLAIMPWTVAGAGVVVGLAGAAVALASLIPYSIASGAAADALTTNSEDTYNQLKQTHSMASTAVYGMWIVGGAVVVIGAAALAGGLGWGAFSLVGGGE